MVKRIQSDSTTQSNTSTTGREMQVQVEMLTQKQTVEESRRSRGGEETAETPRQLDGQMVFEEGSLLGIDVDGPPCSSGSSNNCVRRISFADDRDARLMGKPPRAGRLSLQHSSILPQTPPPPSKSSKSRRRKIRKWITNDVCTNSKTMFPSYAPYSGLLSRRSAGASVYCAPSTANQLRDKNKTSRAVWVFRSFFWCILFLVAITLASVAYRIISKSERELAEQQWLALTSRYLQLGGQIGAQRSIVVKSLAQIVSTAFPDKQAWPNVAIPNFRQTAQELSRGSAEVSFFPKIMPQHMPPTLFHDTQEQSDFETFAYQYFYDTRHEEFEFDYLSGAVHGRGIWKWTDNGTMATSDNDGIVQDQKDGWHSYYRYLFPLLQTTNPGNDHFLFNAHSTRLMGEPLDEVIRCSDVRRQQSDRGLNCGIMTGTSPFDRTSYLIEPVYPANHPFAFTGVVTSQFSWDSTLSAIFEDGIIPALTAVLTGEGQNYTYSVYEGRVDFVAQGDLSDKRYSSYQRTVLVSGQEDQQQQDDDDPYGPAEYMRQTSYYTLTLYPNNDFFKHYTTSLPFVTTSGAVLIVALTSFMFLIYDFFVRREFDSKRQLLEAKRHFMRFVSHEVRTPMNAVNMGLALLHDEIEEVNKARLSRCHAQRVHDHSRRRPFQVASSSSVIADQSSTNTTCCTSCTDTCSPHCHDCDLSCQNELKDLESSLEQWLVLVNEICESADASVEVLNDLLHYDKIQMGSFTMERTVFSLCPLLEDISKEFRLSARKKNITFELDMTSMLETSENRTSAFKALEDFKVVADRIRITQIARNLVSNAIKFTEEGGNICITLSWTPHLKAKRKVDDVYTLQSGATVSLPRQGMLCLAVKDSGAGMSELQLASLFQDGAQFNVNELQAGHGSGLGLYISKGMAEQHGGSLIATSEGLGKGTTFTLAIPLYWMPQEDQEEAEDKEYILDGTYEIPTTTTIWSELSTPSEDNRILEDEENQLGGELVQAVTDPSGLPGTTQEANSRGQYGEMPNLHILVVDDVASNRKLIARLARHRKHIVEEAVDGQDAVEKVQDALEDNDKRSFDVILMDYEMPRMNGPTAVKSMRQLGCEALIVGVTGNVLAEDVALFVNCGANEVLPKPVKFAKLEQIWMESSLL